MATVDWRPRIREMGEDAGGCLANLADEEYASLWQNCGECLNEGMSELDRAVLCENEVFFKKLEEYRVLLDSESAEVKAYFAISARRCVPDNRRGPLDLLMYMLWNMKPLCVLDMLYPAAEYTDRQLAEALSPWSVQHTAQLLQLVRLLESVQRIHRSENIWVDTACDDFDNRCTLRGGRPLFARTCSCQGSETIQILAMTLSGSTREGVTCTDDECKVLPSSDRDYLCHLGPTQLLSRLRIEPTENVGYVLLRFPGSEGCPSAECSNGLFSALRIRTPGRIPDDGSVLTCAPSAASTEIVKPLVGPELAAVSMADYVFCVPDIDWPADTYRDRQKYQGYITKDIVERISRGKAYLVTKGFKGSENEEHQFRYSFSRQECILMRLLHPTHREVLVILKLCKNCASSRLSSVKSYHLKTCVLWVAEECSCLDLETLIWAVLDRLLKSVQSRHLSCFFWPDVNLFASLDDSDMYQLTLAVQLMVRILPATLNIAVHRHVFHRLTKYPHQEIRFMRRVDEYEIYDRGPLTSQDDIAATLFQRFCVEKVADARDEYEHREELRVVFNEVPVSKMSVTKCRAIFYRLLPPRRCWAGYLVQAIANTASCEVLLRERCAADGTVSWLLDLSWFFQPCRRHQYVPWLDEVMPLLHEQWLLPPGDRLPGLEPYLEPGRPVSQMSSLQLCRLYTTGRLLYSLSQPYDSLSHTLTTVLRRREVVTPQLLRMAEGSELQDAWMPDYNPLKPTVSGK